MGYVCMQDGTPGLLVGSAIFPMMLACQLAWPLGALTVTSQGQPPPGT